MFAKRRASLALGDLTGWRSGHETLTKWRLDAPTPMERNRILDPTPDRGAVEETLRRARKLLPTLGGQWESHTLGPGISIARQMAYLQSVKFTRIPVCFLPLDALDTASASDLGPGIWWPILLPTQCQSLTRRRIIPIDLLNQLEGRSPISKRGLDPTRACASDQDLSARLAAIDRDASRSSAQLGTQMRVRDPASLPNYRIQHYRSAFGWHCPHQKTLVSTPSKR
jgi:hypothetical protein